MTNSSLLEYFRGLVRLKSFVLVCWQIRLNDCARQLSLGLPLVAAMWLFPNYFGISYLFIDFFAAGVQNMAHSVVSW